MFAHYLPHSWNNCMVHTEICLIGWPKRQWNMPLTHCWPPGDVSWFPEACIIFVMRLENAKRKWKICCIIGQVLYKRTISWSRFCPKTRVEVQMESSFAWVRSVHWLAGVRLTVEQGWRSAMFYDEVPLLNQIIATEVIICSCIIYRNFFAP